MLRVALQHPGKDAPSHRRPVATTTSGAYDMRAGVSNRSPCDVRRERQTMLIGERLRDLREQKKMSQGDIEKRTGLLRCYISRVENGHTVPAIETLEKMARAFQIPLYQLFYDGDELPEIPNLLERKTSAASAWGSFGRKHVFS